jgi:SAM-dependent methyltransferase
LIVPFGIFGTQKRRLSIPLVLLLIVGVLTALHFPRQTDPPLPPVQPDPKVEKEKAFYNKAYAPRGTVVQGVDQAYEPREQPANEHLDEVKKFVQDYGMAGKKVLDVGAGDGSLQNLVEDYTGLDISETSRRFFTKPFFQGSATELPFEDAHFDAVWTVYTLEHVPNPEQMLREMRRVVKDGGIIYLLAAWYVGSWKADGYEVRPFSDFGFKDKLVKASVPIRRSVYYRSLYTFPIRVIRGVEVKLSSQPSTFRYNPVVPNYTHHWGAADGDAVNNMDAYEVILWHTSRGDKILNALGFSDQFFFRKGELVIEVHKGK